MTTYEIIHTTLTIGTLIVSGISIVVSLKTLYDGWTRNHNTGGDKK